MSEITSNKTILSNLPGGFAIMPNALIGFISDKACAVFLKIYQCQFTSDSEKCEEEVWVKLSTPCLAAALERSKNTIVMALDELIGFGFIKCRIENRKSTFYAIDWEEIVFACNVLCRVNRKGRQELYKICVQSKYDPKKASLSQNMTENSNIQSKYDRMSKIDPNIINTITTQYPTPSTFSQNMTETYDIQLKSDPTSHVQSDFNPKNNDSVNFRLGMELCDEPMEFQSKYNPTSNDDDITFSQNMTQKNKVQSDFNPTDDGFGQFLNTEIYNKEKKKKLSERSSQYRDNKDKELLDYFSTRDLSLPVFDQTFYEFFLEQDIDDADDDVIKSIKTVWGQLGYDDELSAENFIDLRTFKNILYHSWAQLKEDYPDYSLSEEDMKNIFGFLIMEHEGEDCLYIDPSKLRDLSTPVSRPVKEKSTRNFQFTDRTSRRLFLDCVNEVADEDEQLLTSSEFVALLLIDYANDHASGPFSIELPKLAYEDLLKDFSENSHVPVEDIRTLFKDLPQRHKVTLSPQQLIPDRFFQYNDAHKEQSKVKELLLKRLEEEE